LLAQDQFPGSLLGMIGLVESVAPVVKNSAANTEVSRELDDVAARIHSLNSLLSEFFPVSLPLALLHFAAPFPQSVHDWTVSLQKFTLNRGSKNKHF
jgi:hypothetical protein